MPHPYNINMRLSNVRIRTLSDINKDIAQVFFAAVFVGPLIEGSTNGWLVLAGLILSLAFWFISTVLAYETN
ncbi:MAG: hypothetical protein Greene071436_16 [Parcubacteria group bacterium Greene0714_36]|nr:MAG: hypothetical protein Greene071436_16 [Parcubacteria group bacterium Greene0714_36]